MASPDPAHNYGFIADSAAPSTETAIGYARSERMPLATLWITYAWADNEENDVDFIAQELVGHGLNVKLDRWNIGAGRRLWEQIDHFITSPDESDAWLIVATHNSLESEACKEEFAYALNRALSTRGATFPVIALFLGPVEDTLIPAGIKTRLYVSVADVDWKDRIVAAAENRVPLIDKPDVAPYVIKVHENVGHTRFAIELRPRAGVWAPFFVAIPLAEREVLTPSIMVGPRDVPTSGGMLVNMGESATPDGKWWAMFAGNQASPTTSYFLWCAELPSVLLFGSDGRPPQYSVTLGAGPGTA